jgi:hypothetical protein
MAIYLRALEACPPAEHAALARELGTPAAAAMRLCTASVWNGGELASAQAGGASQQHGWGQALTDVTARLGPGLAFRMGTMLVGPAVGGHIAAQISLA